MRASTPRVRRDRELLIAVLLAASAPALAAGAAKEVGGLPPGDRWVEHVRTELLPFWNQPDAWGTPPGNFPTYRCNDGRRIDPARPCREARDAPAWMKEGMDHQYVRMMGRQIYFYCVAYHLLGDPALLAHARDGVGYLRAHALDPETGSAATLLQDGRPAGPPVLARTAQDLAYAQVGLAMYWYLTRDPEVLGDLERLKDHVFGRYWDPEWGMLRWTVQGEERGRKELVAQLDQINAYLLLVTPGLPEPQRAEWRADLSRLARVLREKFFAPAQHLFWGTLDAPDSTRLGARHNDFGHTAKALWMLERIGRLTGDEELVAFAAREASEVLGRAQLRDGVWGSRPLPDGSVDAGKEWWIYAELDQLTATLALADPSKASVLAKTYPFWLRSFVDRDGGEVWGWVDKDGKPGGGLKVHLWKSGYHSAEHALVAYLTTQALQGKPVTVYYAFEARPEELRPYYFAADVQAAETSPLPGFEGRQRWKVTFAGLR
jgi:mannose/cellobiose epimerase-like protein (N-acyl-D-glucosamine 2-epimerase family)